MRGSFHIFLEHLINSTYQHQRIRLTQSGFYGKVHSYASSYIRFGGWDINYNGKGWTRLFIEKVGNIEFVSKAIYLNVNYTYRLAGLPTYPNFDFSNLINTVAHELAHCLLGDFNLNWAKLHDVKTWDINPRDWRLLMNFTGSKRIGKVSKKNK